MGISGFQTTFFDWREPRQIKQIRLIHLFFDMTPTVIPCTDRDRHSKIAFLFSFTLFRGRSPRYKLHRTDRRSVGFAHVCFDKRSSEKPEYNFQTTFSLKQPVRHKCPAYTNEAVSDKMETSYFHPLYILRAKPALQITQNRQP